MRFHKWKIGIFVPLIGFTWMFLRMENQSNAWKSQISCAADHCLMMMNPLEYTIAVVPLLMIAIVLDTQKDFCGSRVLFYRSKKDLFFEQSWQAVKWSVMFTVIYLLTIFVYQQWNGQCIYNWDDERSYFCITNKEIFQGSPAEVFFIIFLICVYRNLIISAVILLSKWYFRHITAGFLTVLVVCLFEFAQSKTDISIFLKRLNTGYSFWISRSQELEVAVSMLLYLAVLYFVTKKAIVKKEFLDEDFLKKSGSP